MGLKSFTTQHDLEKNTGTLLNTASGASSDQQLPPQATAPLPSSPYMNHSFFEVLTHYAHQLGTEAAIIPTQQIPIEDDLASLCVESHCENYGLSAKCPPYVAGPTGFRTFVKHFDYALIIKLDAPATIETTQERLRIMKALHIGAAGLERMAIALGHRSSKAFVGGSCKTIFCHDYPECQVLHEGGKCRNPEFARRSMSGFGINANKLLRAAGWQPTTTSHKGFCSNSLSWVAGLVLLG